MDTFVIPVNVHDNQPYLNWLDRQRNRFDFKTTAVGLDAGYLRKIDSFTMKDKPVISVLKIRFSGIEQHAKGTANTFPIRAYVALALCLRVRHRFDSCPNGI